MFSLQKLKIYGIVLCIIILSATSALAQTTQFTYQGRFTDSAVPSPTNGTYEMQFALFDAASGGNQVGSTISSPTVQVVNGIFTVQLDYGSSPFHGIDIYLEIRPFSSASNSFVTLNPRQKVTSAPYAIQSLNSNSALNANDAASLGGIAANQFVQTSDPRLNDTRTPTAGSPSYIQNQTAASQAAGLNISGSATIGGTISGNGANVSNLNAGNVTTGTLLPSRGGTGVNASGLDGNILRSNGTTWVSTPIQSIDIPAGSVKYIQNTSNQQALSNFNVSGTGTANILNAVTQYNIGGSRVFSVGGINNTIAGVGAGLANTGLGNSFFGFNAGNANIGGGGNSFYGNSAGAANVAANFNSFFGNAAGFQNNSGSGNSYFGFAAGNKNTSGSENSFFGTDAGNSNTTASGNSFFGRSAGKLNIAASNSFFGYSAGGSNTTGTQNSFFGENAGSSNTTGGGNSFFGYRAGENNTNVNNAFFGALAGQSNTIGGSNSFFGYNAGHANTSGDSNTFIGRNAGSGNAGGDSNSFVGFNAGLSNVDGNANAMLGSKAGQNLTTGIGNTFVGFQAGQSYTGLAGQGSNTLIGYNTKIDCSGCFTPITHATAIGADAVARYDHEIVLGTASDDTRTMGNLYVGVGGAGNTLYTDQIFTTVSGGGSISLCLTHNPGYIAACSSSLRYKTNIASYANGYEVIKRLTPITFDWKSDGMHDVGFGAEDVAKVDPLLVTFNKDGIVEGVKYDRISAALVNAVKEQQIQIDRQQIQIKQMELQFSVLKGLISSQQKQRLRKSRRASQRPDRGVTK